MKKGIKKGIQIDNNIWESLRKEIKKLEPTSRINELKKLLEKELNKEIVKEIKSDIDNALKELQEQRSIRVSGAEEIPRARRVETADTSTEQATERSLDNIVETETKEEMKEQRVVTYGASGSMGGGQGPYMRGGSLYSTRDALTGSRENVRYIQPTTLGIQDSRFWEGRTRGIADSRWQAHLRASREIVGDERWRSNLEETSSKVIKTEEEKEKIIKSEEFLYKETKYKRGERQNGF